MSIILTGFLMEKHVATEDDGAAMIAELDYLKTSPDDGAFFVRLQSWSETKQHATFQSLIGKQIRITIEVE